MKSVSELSGNLSFQPGVELTIALHVLPTVRHSAFLLSAFHVPSTSFFSVLFQIK